MRGCFILLFQYDMLGQYLLVLSVIFTFQHIERESFIILREGVILHWLDVLRVVFYHLSTLLLTKVFRQKHWRRDVCQCGHMASVQI